MVERAANIWADGPSSDPYWPSKPRIREWGTNLETTLEEQSGEVGGLSESVAAVEATINSLQLGQQAGVVVFQTKAVMDATLTYPANTEARVYNDPLPGFNGIYQKSGASGAGSWVRIRSIDSYNYAISVIVGQSSIGILSADISRTRLSVANPNLAAKVAININGGLASFSDPSCIVVQPGKGIYLDAADCPTASIAFVSDQPAIAVDVGVSNTAGGDPTIDYFITSFAIAPTVNRKAAISAFRGALLAAGILQKLDGLWVFAAANADAAGVNWIDGSKILTTSGGPTFTSDRGYTGDGVDAVLRTGVTLPSNNYRRNSAFMAAWVLDAAAGISQWTMGFGAGALQANRSATSMGVRANNGTTQPITTGGASGFYAWSRLDTASYKAFWGSAFSQSAALTPDATIVARELVGLALNGVSGPGSFSSNQVALMAAGAGLTDTEIATFRLAAQAYLSSVGAA